MRCGRLESARLPLLYMLRITQDLRTYPTAAKSQMGDQERVVCTTSGGVSRVVTSPSPISCYKW